MVLFVFIVMLFQLQEPGPTDQPEPKSSKIPKAFFLGGKSIFAFLGCGMILGIFFKFIQINQGPFYSTTSEISNAPPVSSLKQIASVLFSKYIIAFELLSVVLLVAMLGAIMLARRESKHAK